MADDPEEADDTPNAADPASVKRSREKAKLKDDNRTAFWKRVLADPTGRLVIWETLSEMLIHGEPFVMTGAGIPSDHGTFFRMGIQHFGRMLYQRLLRMDAEGVLLMHSEHDPAWQVTKPKRGKATP